MESFLRLKSLEVGYSFSKKWIKRVAMENMRLYFNGLEPVDLQPL